MITLADYIGKHEARYSHLLSVDDRANGARTVELLNAMLVLAKAGGVSLEANPDTGSILSSGWRPGPYNSTVPNAKRRSNHILLKAGDLYDPDGDLDEWCLVNADSVLRDLGLWLEHPAATKGWCHLQTVPPRSGRRVFYP